MLAEVGAALSKLGVGGAPRVLRLRRSRNVDLKGSSQGDIDLLFEGQFAADARKSQSAGMHRVDGSATFVNWMARRCGMSVTSAADRLCVGRQLESLPKIADALRTGEIGYQSTALLCHLRDQLGEKRELFDEDEMLEQARNHSVGRLRYLCRVARHVADPDGFFNEAEDGLHAPRWTSARWVTACFASTPSSTRVRAPLKTALDSLAKRWGRTTTGVTKQRMADSMGELVNHAMDEGKLPRRNGVRPHINLTDHAGGPEERARRTAGRSSSSHCRSRRGRWSASLATAQCRGCCSPTRW